MRVVVVGGTDTGVGKTIVTAALAAVAHSRGERVAVIKPVQTGVQPHEPGDLDEVRRLARIDDLHELARLPEPLAPATAARLAGLQLPTADDVVQTVNALRDRDLVLIEGSGGLLVHLDAQGATLIDLALALSSAVVLVARSGLGTLNHSALSCEALRARGAECTGVVIGAWPRQPDLTAKCNLEDLPVYTGQPVVGLMPENAGGLDAVAFLGAAKRALSEEVTV